MSHDPLQPLTPEEGGLHGDIPDTPETRAWFQELGEKAQTATHDPLCQYAKAPKEVQWHLCACCAWVKEVRADERNKIFTSLDKLADLGHTDDCRDLTCGGCVTVEDDE